MTERDPIDQRLMLARAASWAPDAAKARVRANLAASGATSVAPDVAARAAGVTKWTTALLVGTGFVAGYWLGVYHSAEPREAASAMSASNATEAISASPTTSVASSRTPEPAPAPVASAAAAPPAPEAAPAAHPASPKARRALHDRAAPSGRALLKRTPAPPVDSLGDELALLARTERAIRAGEPALALSFLDELDARFPSSAMIEERMAARSIAECGLSNPGARRRAELFLSDRAASVYTDRVRRSCGLEAPSAMQRTSASPADDGSSQGGH